MTDQRPVPLIEGVIDRGGVYQFLDINGSTRHEQLIPSREIVTRTDKPSAQDVIVPLVRKLVNAGEKVIVFRNKRGFAQGCANYLARDLGLASAGDIIDLLPASDTSGASSALRTSLQGGTAFHTTNLTREERVVVERAFRDPDSRVRVLAATTTVAAGINTPASTVILAEQEFVGEEGRPFTVAEYKNMAGRAGRLGFQEKGKSIIYADTPFERDRLFRTYVLGSLESLRSSFDERNFDTWLLRLLAQVTKIPRKEVSRLLANTYAGYLQVRRNPAWRSGMEREVSTLLDRMIRLGLLEVEGDHVRLSLLGRACGRSALSFNSALRLVELVRSIPRTTMSAQNMVAFIQVLDEAEGGYTPMLPGPREGGRVGDAAQRYGHDIVLILQRYASAANEYWARCKRAAILFDWVHGSNVERIEAQFSTTPFRGRIEHGDIRRFADATRFVLRSAGEILSLLLPDTDISEEFDTVLDQLEVGIPTEALGLLKLPVPLTRGQYLDLYHSGLSTVDAVWAAVPDRLSQILPQPVVSALELQRPVSQSPKKPVDGIELS
jgi:replicative superfamily II helicase